MDERGLLWALRHACLDAWRMARFERPALRQMAMRSLRRRARSAGLFGQEFAKISSWALKASLVAFAAVSLALLSVALADFAWSSLRSTPRALAMVVPARSCALGEHFLEKAQNLPPSLLPVAADVLMRQAEGQAPPCRAEIGPQGSYQWTLLLQAPLGGDRLGWAGGTDAREFARRIGAPAARFEPVERGPFWTSLAEGLGLSKATSASRAQAISAPSSLWLGLRGARFDRWLGPALLALSLATLAGLFWKFRHPWLDDLRELARSLPSPSRLARQSAMALAILGGLWSLGWILFALALLAWPQPSPVLAAPASAAECAPLLDDPGLPVFCRIERGSAIAISPAQNASSPPQPNLDALRKANFPSVAASSWLPQPSPSSPGQALRAAGEVAGLLTPSKASRAIFQGRSLEPWLGLALLASVGAIGAFLASQAAPAARWTSSLLRQGAKLPAKALRRLASREDFHARAIRRELHDATPHGAPRRERGRL